MSKEHNEREDVSKYTMRLEEEFNKYRPFGDERDFEVLKELTCNRESQIFCEIHNKAPHLFPEIALDPDNLVYMCENCVINAIEFFKKNPNINNLTLNGEIT